MNIAKKIIINKPTPPCKASNNKNIIPINAKNTKHVLLPPSANRNAPTNK